MLTPPHELVARDRLVERRQLLVRHRQLEDLVQLGVLADEASGLGERRTRAVSGHRVAGQVEPGQDPSALGAGSLGHRVEQLRRDATTPVGPMDRELGLDRLGVVQQPPVEPGDPDPGVPVDQPQPVGPQIGVLPGHQHAGLLQPHPRRELELFPAHGLPHLEELPEDVWIPAVDRHDVHPRPLVRDPRTARAN